MRRVKILLLLALIMSTFSVSGCGTVKKINKNDDLLNEVALWKRKYEVLEQEKNDEIAQLQMEKERKVSDLESAKRDLEESLKKEIGEYKAKLDMTERGLVITFVSEIFFDPGKDEVKEEGENALENVAKVLTVKVLDSPIAIEGHTDNDPIKHSHWKSNWELSTARSLSVLHYLIDNAGINSERLSAVGYGEYRPVASNETEEGKKKNRRVEIVILPSKIKKVAGIN